MASEFGTSDTDEPSDLTRREGSHLITDADFVKLGGAAELVAVGLVVVSLVVSVTSGLPNPNPDPAAMGGWLSEVNTADAMYRTTSWLFVVDHLLEIVFVVALYHLLRDAGRAMWLALVAGVLGLFSVALSGVLQIGLAELATSYVAADGPARSGVLASAVALDRIRIVLNLVGTVLAWGVGGALFSVGILRTEVVSRWLGWLGLAFALVIWLNGLRLVSDVFEPLIVVMLVVGLVWLPSMGLALLRVTPERVPGSG